MEGMGTRAASRLRGRVSPESWSRNSDPDQRHRPESAAAEELAAEELAVEELAVEELDHLPAHATIIELLRRPDSGTSGGRTKPA